MNTNEAIEIVSEIRDEIIEQFPEYDMFNEYNSFDMYPYGLLTVIAFSKYEFAIKFLGETIFCSENDCTNYIEETDDYEPLDTFLRRELTKICSKLNTIKL